MIHFRENKDRFIDKNTLLTDEQKALVKDFFTEHPEQEGKIKNWNYNIPYETFEQVIVNLYNKNTPKKGLSSLREGIDYDILGRDENYTYYAIYTFGASVAFASNNVGKPFWSKVPSWYEIDNVRKDYPIKDLQNTDIYGGAKWCISMNHTDKYWVQYHNADKVFFIFAISNDEDVLDIYSKLAITLYRGTNIIYNIYTPYDNTLSESSDTYSELKDKVNSIVGKFDFRKVQAKDYIGELKGILVPYIKTEREKLNITSNTLPIVFNQVAVNKSPSADLDKFLTEKHVTKSMLKNDFESVKKICIKGVRDFYKELKDRWTEYFHSEMEAFLYLLTEGCYIKDFVKEKDTVIKVLFSFWLEMDIAKEDYTGCIPDFYNYLNKNAEANNYDALMAIRNYLDEKYPTDSEYESFVKRVFNLTKTLLQKNDMAACYGMWNLISVFYDKTTFLTDTFYFKKNLENI